MFILGIIPARKNSKRCPGKNTRLLGSKPLVLWTIEAAKESKFLSYVVGTTDDPQVMAIFANNNMPCIKRPDNLATDDASIYDVIFHAVDNCGFKPDSVCLLQPTSPFRTALEIDMVLGYLILNECIYSTNSNGKPNGSLYAAKLDWLQVHQTFEDGNQINLLKTDSIDIDTEEDFQKAEEYARQIRSA